MSDKAKVLNDRIERLEGAVISLTTRAQEYAETPTDYWRYRRLCEAARKYAAAIRLLAKVQP